VALVTGAGRGLGRAHAMALAAAGASVVVNDIGAALDGSGRDDAPAAAVVAEVEALGGRAVADDTDVASLDGGARTVANAIAAFERIDILVNNAGFAHGGGDVEAPIDAELDALLAVHFKAAVGTMSAAFADMRTRRWGRIINTVSEVVRSTSPASVPPSNCDLSGPRSALNGHCSPTGRHSAGPIVIPESAGRSASVNTWWR
jgi:NAD(P)-dependent dehydrogenase (short-subunit alcohol dehydrogenase family)